MSGDSTDSSLGLPKLALGPLLDLRRQILQSGDLTTSATIEILQSDQLERWRRGERIPAEAYLHLWAELPASAFEPEWRGVHRDLIYAELLHYAESLAKIRLILNTCIGSPQFRKQLELVAELEEYVDSGLTAEAQVSTLSGTRPGQRAGTAASSRLQPRKWLDTRSSANWGEAAWASSTRPGRLRCSGWSP